MAANRRAAPVNGVRIMAPAKVNLGLAVRRKRPDGYHDIDTIMAMIDLADALTIRHTEEAGIVVRGMDDVPAETNLITKAIRGFCQKAGTTSGFHVEIEKHIPSPAGLGGGSSDAAGALKALNTLFPKTLTADELHDLAASIGADCPFFLGTPAARATGTGTTLRSIPAPSGWVVVVVPPSEIRAKTATLYASLSVCDYLPASAIDCIERELSAGMKPRLVNSFARAARNLLPAVNDAWKAMSDVTGMCALSGAGPAVYALASNDNEAAVWRTELAHRLPGDYAVFASRFSTNAPQPEPLP